MAVCVSCSREIAGGVPFCSFCGSPNPDGGAAAALTDIEVLRGRLQAALGTDYAVEDQLGEGGFAVVFAVHEGRLSRRIAVKVLRPELVTTPSAKARFVREAENVARLNHPHILPIFFVGESQGLVYFGMPLVEGESLESRLRREGRFGEAEAARIGAEVADALAEAHAAGLVHRDIKPQNVMLQGTKGRVLVADFGIAKAAAASGEKLTEKGIAIGSPHYMSPEQASGDEAVDHRSDVYSLGILLWQMLAGELPFESARSQAVLIQQMTKDVPDVRARRSDVSAAMAAVVARCVAKSPDGRYQSAEEAAQALRAVAAGAAGAPDVPRRLWLVPAGVGAALLLAAAAFALLRPGGLARDGSAGSDAAAPAGDSAAVPTSSAPIIAVLPFSAVATGDSGGQFGRAAALMFGEALALRNGVETVDGNSLLGRWLSQRRQVTAPLDTNARFAYGLGANQMILGNYVQSGSTFRLTATMYDTHDLAALWRDEATGPVDSLFARIDQLASRAAAALCSQPQYNPGSRCYDVAARPRAPVSVAGDSTAAGGRLRLLARVGADGAVTDVRVQEAPVSEAVAALAVAALADARFEPARKAGRAVDAWTEVEVPVVAAAATLAMNPRPAARADGGAADGAAAAAGAAGAAPAAAAADCDDPAVGVRNPGRACWDSRPVPASRLPLVAAPPACRSLPSAATVLVRVNAEGGVEGRPSVTATSDCPAFSDSAVAAAASIVFAPAQKAGRPVDAWTLVLVRPVTGAAGGTE